MMMMEIIRLFLLVLSLCVALVQSSDTFIYNGDATCTSGDYGLKLSALDLDCDGNGGNECIFVGGEKIGLSASFSTSYKWLPDYARATVKLCGNNNFNDCRMLTWKKKIKLCDYLQNNCGGQQEEEGDNGDEDESSYKSSSSYVSRSNVALGEFELPEDFETNVMEQFQYAQKLRLAVSFSPVGYSHYQGNSIYCDIPFVSSEYNNNNHGGYNNYGYAVSMVIAGLGLSVVYGNRSKRRVIEVSRGGDGEEAATTTTDDACDDTSRATTDFVGV